jgi:hypothetical protein
MKSSSSKRVNYLNILPTKDGYHLHDYFLICPIYNYKGCPIIDAFRVEIMNLDEEAFTETEKAFKASNDTSVDVLSANPGMLSCINDYSDKYDKLFIHIIEVDHFLKVVEKQHAKIRDILILDEISFCKESDVLKHIAIIYPADID